MYALYTSQSAGVVIEPYCENETRVLGRGLGQAPNVVFQLVTNANVKVVTCILKPCNIGSGETGTVRQNRLNRVPIVKKCEKMKRLSKQDMSVVAWKDKSVLPVTFILQP